MPDGSNRPAPTSGTPSRFRGEEWQKIIDDRPDSMRLVRSYYGYDVMVPTFVEPYRNGELRIGWASWDDGSYRSRSIKYAYRDSSGKISRGCPELPFDILVDMVILAQSQGELSPDLLGRLRDVLIPKGW